MSTAFRRLPEFEPLAEMAACRRSPQRVVPRFRRLGFEALEDRTLLDTAAPTIIVTFSTSLGSFQVELFADVAPATVANFLKYANDGDYNNTIIHRSVVSPTPFVLQGGGYAYPGTPVPTSTFPSGLSHIPTDPPVVNEYNRSNLRGTIAMAKLGSGPNTATSEWFFNLADNSGNLNNQNGGFTVFGRVLGDGMTIVDAMAAVPTYNGGGAFDDLPLRNYTSQVTALTTNHFVMINSVTVVTGSLSGVSYLDADGDGVRDAGEAGLGGRTIYIDANDNGQLDNGELSTTTNTQGAWTFANLDPDNYVIRENSPAGAQTAPSGGAHRVTLSSGQALQNLDFGGLVVAPVTPDLATGSDTGASSIDNVTASTTLSFVIGGVVPGAVVKLFHNGTEIASGTADSAQITLSTAAAGPLAAGTHQFTAQQTFQGETSAVSTALSVVIDTTTPTLSSVGPQSAIVGQAFSLDMASSEEGQNGVVYSLLNAQSGMAINPTTGVLTWTPAAAQVGVRTATVRIVDLAGNSNQTAITFNVNGPPFIEAIADKVVNVGATVSFSVVAHDLDGFEFSLDSGAPSGATIDPDTGAFSWTPPANQASGQFPVTVRVTDAGGLSSTRSFNIRVNTKPTLADIDDRTIDELVEMVLTAQATDDDQPVYSLVNAPAGATINASTGQIRWTPTEAQGPGDFEFRVRVTDGGGLTDEKVFGVTVNETHRNPELDLIADKTVNLGSSLTFAATGRDLDLPAQSIAYSLDDGAPSGASIDPVTGQFTWTPTAEQAGDDYDVTVRLTDGTGRSAARTFNVRVNAPPVLAEITDRSIVELGDLLIDLVVDNDDGATFTLLEAPAGASIDPVTGQFRWTPSENQGGGEFLVRVRVTDSGGLTDTREFMVTALETDEAPLIAAIADQSVEQGSLFELAIVATDPDIPATALVYRLASGAPEGMSIDPQSGVIRWSVPDTFSEGTFAITVEVTDSSEAELSSTITFNLTVTSNQIGFALFTSSPLSVLGLSAVADGSVLDTLAVGNATLLSRIAGDAANRRAAQAPGLVVDPEQGVNNLSRFTIGADTGLSHDELRYGEAMQAIAESVRRQRNGVGGPNDGVVPASGEEEIRDDSGQAPNRRNSSTDGAAPRKVNQQAETPFRSPAEAVRELSRARAELSAMLAQSAADAIEGLVAFDPALAAIAAAQSGVDAIWRDGDFGAGE